MYQRFKYVLNALLIAALILTLSGVIYFIFLADSPSIRYDSPSSSTLDLTFKTLAGDTITKEHLKGQVTLINFWATWCGACRLEIPELIELQEHYSDQNVKVIGVSVDRDMAPVTKFLHDYKFNYPIAMYSAEHAAFFGHVSAIPTTFIFDKKARVTHVLRGFKNQYELHRIIQSLQ